MIKLISWTESNEKPACFCEFMLASLELPSGINRGSGNRPFSLMFFPFTTTGSNGGSINVASPASPAVATFEDAGGFKHRIHSECLCAGPASLLARWASNLPIKWLEMED